MKKFITAILAGASITAANAIEIGVLAGRDYSAQPHANSVGVSVQTDIDTKLAIGGSIERQTAEGFSQTRTAGSAAYDILTTGPITFVAKSEIAYLDNRNDRSGWAAAIGAGIEYAVTPVVALTADWRYQTSLQNRVSQYSGSNYAIGVKYKF